ncbi:inactive pancreatic lipase-related protein 1-like [Topomyia yanbarensis]|uniref:inactive pancreatic lipase-related protein 1-like n=1 Tax=Topomyia yanbarensis TaxID=2498891 RepID=UPI00273BF415|nr:inactive pancreatic lipase-related protein 1-like [Topomyia yanbarensis]
MKSWIAFWFCLSFGALQTVSPHYFNSDQHVKFYLFTADDPTFPQLLQWSNPETIKKSRFHPADPTRFIIHGYQGGFHSDMNSKFRNGYFKIGHFNVIVVDWGEGAKDYWQFVRPQVPNIGRTIAKMIDLLVQVTGMSLVSVSLIGHCLGAHIAGAAGRAVHGQIGTIIGLDPAGPDFVKGGPDTLTPQDAEYVEVIHTSAAYGFWGLIGTADFFVNGGGYQPSCGTVPHICPHHRAIDYFSESISSRTGFWGRRYNTWHDMVDNKPVSGECRRMGGEPSNFRQGVSGIFNVVTAIYVPYALGPCQAYSPRNN